MALVSSLLAVWCRAATVTNYTDSGNCFELSARFLKASGLPYIIDSRLKSLDCSWDFQGDTRAQFEKWCSLSGLRCGGTPYYVGFDSTWYRGEYMPGPRASWQRVKDSRADSASAYAAERSRLSALRADSLANLPPLPRKSITVEYLEVGKSTAERLGFSYSDYLAGAHFFGYDDLFSVTAQALSIGDSSFIYRTYSSVYDSSLAVFWGGHRDRLMQSNVTSSGIVSNSYTTENYGLTFRVTGGDSYYYEHSADYEHSINGSGLLLPGRNEIFGTYQYVSREVRQVPGLSSIPVLGALFRHSADVFETRYIFLLVTLKEL